MQSDSQRGEDIPRDGDQRPGSMGDLTATRTDNKSSSARIRRVERSCALCHRRKVRCDKKLPCATCTRMGVLCCYPSGSKASPRKEKATISDIASRLAQLERTIVAISSDVTPKRDHGSTEKLPLEPFSEAEDAPTVSEGSETTSSEKTPFGMLVQHGEGDSGHYVNEVLLSRVLEEEQEIQSVLATPRFQGSSTPDADTQSSPAPRSFGLLSLLSHHSPSPADEREYAKFYPQKWQAIRLWQTFVQNVDNLNKLLHVPTVQVIIYSVIDDPDGATADVKCLMFATYFAATTSLSPGEVFSLLGQDKTDFLTQFSAGLEISLAAANVLNRPSIMALQALGLYLQAVRAHHTGRSVWILNGMALRVAQSIGLHRDPSRFGLSPFEAEMRRRLWWHILTHDSRAAEDHGLAVSTLDPTTDTRWPLSVDDSALDPAMTELPIPPVGRFTDMTMASLIYEISHISQRLYRMLPTSGFGDPDATPSESARRDVLNKLKARVLSQLNCCNPVIPIQRAVSLMVRAMVSKVDFVSRQQWIYHINAKRESSEARISEDSLIDGCQILEMHRCLQTDELLRNYRWTAQIYPQYHVILYILWHLSVKPLGPNVGRAWSAVDGAFDLEVSRRQRREVQTGFGAKWEVLEALRQKALRIRDAAGSSAADGTDPATEEMATDTETLGWDKAFEDRLDMGWEAGFLDWDGLVDDLNATNVEAMETG